MILVRILKPFIAVFAHHRSGRPASKFFAAAAMWCALCLSPFIGVAQVDWEKLSTRERIQIAEREKLESKTDAEFQQLMHEGHRLFEGRHYLQAIHKYEEAQQKRPYNVYPKVIIADIELSMKDTLQVLRRAEQEQRSRQNTRARRPQPDTTRSDRRSEPKLTETKEETIDRLDEWERQVRRDRRQQRANDTPEVPPSPSSSGDVGRMTIEEYQSELGREYPQGVTETVEKQGNKTITNRIVVQGDKGNAYRKVEHDWGGIFYFKNGEAVTERVWSAETDPR